MSGKTNIVRLAIDRSGSGVLQRRPALPIAEGHDAWDRPEPTECQPPPIDIYESPEGLVLEADLPGASEAGIIVQLEDNVLYLYAKLDLTTPLPEGARLVHEEFRPLDYARTFILSHEIDRDGITAQWRQGVLRLVLPFSRRGISRRIEVKGQ